MNLLQRLASNLRLMRRRPARIQYAALCYRQREGCALEILLITSRDTGRWVIPKGWPMKGKRAHEVAAQEAYEEAGTKGDCRRSAIGFYTYKKRMDNGLTVSCKVQIHPLQVDCMRKNFPERGERKRSWFDYRIAARRVAEASLRDQILRFGRSF